MIKQRLKKQTSNQTDSLQYSLVKYHTLFTFDDLTRFQYAHQSLIAIQKLSNCLAQRVGERQTEKVTPCAFCGKVESMTHLIDLANSHQAENNTVQDNYCTFYRIKR